MAYASLSDIQALNPKRTYSATTTPTSTQVSALIDQIAAEIDAELMAKGYEAPATTPTEWVTFLKAVNAYGAAALAEMGMFPETSEQGSTPHWKVLYDTYKKWMKEIEEEKITPSSVSGANVGGYYTDVADQDEYPDPVFRIRPEDKDF